VSSPSDAAAESSAGVVREILPSGVFKVDLDSGATVIAHRSQRLRFHRVEVRLGDRVQVEQLQSATSTSITFRYS
jgi:translation initiation factor IF-1